MSRNVYYQKNQKATLRSFISDYLREITPTTSQSKTQLTLPIIQSVTNQRIRIGLSYLTQRGRECVTALLNMIFYFQVADALGLSKRTVEYYIENIKRKYDLTNKKQLIDYFRYVKPWL